MEANRVELLSCSICLELLKDPVSLLCGHNYCKNCIEVAWAREEKNIYRCPQCRQTFTPKPFLQKNTVLAELVEELKKTGPADLCYAGPEDVACDACTGRKLKALKSCMMCVVSYCEQHLQPHLEAPAFRRHKLVHPSKQLQEIICSQHDEEKKMFCRTDQQVICHLCAEDQHKDHHIVSAAAERREREKEVHQSRGRIQRRIQEREEEVTLLQQQEENITVSADKAVKDSQETLNKLIQNLQRMMTDEEQLIRSQQRREVARVRGLQQQLQQEIIELKKKDSELQQLSLADSHLVFLQNSSSLSEVSEDLLSRTQVHPQVCFEEVAAAVSASRARLQDLLRDTWTNISRMLAPEPKIRAEFLRHSRDITLDPATAHSELMLSEGCRKVTDMGKDQSPPHHPARFTNYPQVLSKETLTGRCYWEVKWTGYAGEVAVSYKNISRSGREGSFGRNNQSWSLSCNNSGCTFKHNRVTTEVSSVRPSTVGVYLDHSAGLLSFYSVSDTMTLLHRVQTTFTQPLLAGLYVGSTCEFLKLIT
ncbi:tripartite motif-containing protein 16-like [Neosynchiropus ocellatus]